MPSSDDVESRAAAESRGAAKALQNLSASVTRAESRAAKAQLSFQNLSASALKLNTASDAFGNAIRSLDEALTQLNPGVSAWVTFHSDCVGDQPCPTRDERLGFDKVNGRWGLGIMRVTIDHDGTETTEDTWLFNDAPRKLRLRAIQCVPYLLEALAREAEQTATSVGIAAEFAFEMARSVAKVANEKGNRR